jgi:chorismate-pyruvate lyase
MSKARTPLVMAVKEHLLGGNRITQLECIVLFGVPSLTKVISDMRKEGWIVESQRIPFVAALRRINEHALLEPPKNLPVREVVLTEYWINR